MTDFKFLSDTNGPWIFIVDKPISKQDVSENILRLNLDGRFMNTMENMYVEFSRVFRFPDYFGKNINALSECLSDLDWLPSEGYLVEIMNAEVFLNDEPDDVFEYVVSILGRIGEEWATPIVQGEVWDRDGLPFHTVLYFSGFKGDKFSRRIKNIDILN